MLAFGLVYFKSRRFNSAIKAAMEGLEVPFNSGHVVKLTNMDYLEQASSLNYSRSNMMIYEDHHKSPLLQMLGMEATEPNNLQYLLWLQQMKKPSTAEYSVDPAFELESCIIRLSESHSSTNHPAIDNSLHQESNSEALKRRKSISSSKLVSMQDEKVEQCLEKKKKRKRATTCKNREDSENQRMTHIAVERNRRKQMNELLIALRTVMPLSHVQRGDQASIVEGAIDFIKELEQLLHSLEAKKMMRQRGAGQHLFTTFSGFFNSPQYSTYSSATAGEERSPAASSADVEVTVVHGHVNLKVLSPRRPGQLLRTVAALEVLHLSILHLNVTSLEEAVLYSFSMKIEEGCKQVCADEIAAAVHHIFNQ